MHKKVGILGLGFIADRHIQAIRKAKGRIVYGVDIEPRNKTKLPSGAMFFRDYRQAVRSEKGVDYIVVCLPNNMHKEAIEFCAQEDPGAVVVVEKPLVFSIKDFSRILEIEKNGVDIRLVMQMRESKVLREMKKRSRTRQRGEMSICLDMVAFRDKKYMESWKGRPEASGGILYNLAIHYIDIILWLLGEPEQITMERQEPNGYSGMFASDIGSARWNCEITTDPDAETKRTLIVNGEEIDLRAEIPRLHYSFWENVFSGGGLRPAEQKVLMRTLHRISGVKHD